MYPFFAPLSHETAALPTQFPTPNTFNFYFSRTSQAKSLFLAPTSATWHFPLAPFLMTFHAMAHFLYRVSAPLFVALSTGHLGAFLGPSWAIFGGRLGSIRGHLGAVCSLVRCSFLKESGKQCFCLDQRAHRLSYQYRRYAEATAAMSVD